MARVEAAAGLQPTEQHFGPRVPRTWFPECMSLGLLNNEKPKHPSLAIDVCVDNSNPGEASMAASQHEKRGGSSTRAVVSVTASLELRGEHKRAAPLAFFVEGGGVHAVKPWLHIVDSSRTTSAKVHHNASTWSVIMRRDLLVSQSRSACANAHESDRERKRERLEQCCSAPVSILFRHFGGYAPAGGITLRKSGGEWHTRRQTTEMMDPGSESGQKVVEGLAALRLGQGRGREAPGKGLPESLGEQECVEGSGLQEKVDRQPESGRLPGDTGKIEWNVDASSSMAG